MALAEGLTVAASTLHQDVGHLEGKLESLEKSVEKLTDKVESLTAALNQAQGAKIAIFAIPAIISVITTVAAFFGLVVGFPKGH